MVVQLPLGQVDWDPDDGENTLPVMNPHLVPPEFVKEIVKEQDGVIEKTVVAPVAPVAGEAEHPLTA